jgi:transposase-like protein
LLLKGERAQGTLAKEKPPIFGMLQRASEVVIRMLENVHQVTIAPLIKRTIAPGSVVYTNEYEIYSRLNDWGDNHETVCYAARRHSGSGPPPRFPVSSSSSSAGRSAELLRFGRS